MSENKKNLGKLIISILLFFYLATILVIILRSFGITLNGDNNLHLVAVDFAVSGLLSVILMILHFDLIKEGKKKISLKYGKNIWGFFKTVIIAFLVMYIVKIVAAQIDVFLLTLFGLSEESTVENQALIEELMASAPAMMIISTSIFAPIEEELLFRGAIGKVIKNKKVFILVSGLIFGLMHVTGSITLLLELLLLGVVMNFILSNDKISKDNKKMLSVISLVSILLLFGGIFYFQKGNLISIIMKADLVEVFGSVIYIAMGIFLAALYAKEDNIILNIAVHAINNILGVIALLFLI